MKVLAINGSPRKGGNTELLLKTVTQNLEEHGWESEYIQIGGKTMRGCLACNTCREKKNMQCIIDSDSFNDIFAKMAMADALLLGSPTYFTDVSAEMKALLDRSGYVALANERVFKAKIGAAVVAVRRAGATHVFDTINHMFLINNMIVPGSTYWNLGIGRDKGEVSGDEEGLNNMKNLAQTIAWLGKAISPLKDEFPS